MDLDNTPAEAAPPANPHLDGEALAALELETAAVDQPPAEAPKESETAAVLELVMAPAFDVIAPNWNITKSEVQTLAGAYAAVIDKHFPDALNGFGVELTAVIMTLAIVAPRMNKPRKIEAAKPEPAAHANA